METWALIYNPRAGGFSPNRLEGVERELHAAGIRARLLPTARLGHAESLARAAEGVARVAVYGGDGTLNEAANALLGRGLPLVYLPGGTANVMGHELGLPLHPVRAARRMARSVPRAIRPGLLGERCFLLMAGFGLDGAAVYGVRPALKARLGRAAYVLSGFAALTRRQPSLRVERAGLPPLHGAWIVAARARRYGGAYVLHPGAGLTRDGLGWIAVEASRLPRFLAGRLLLRRATQGPEVFPLQDGPCEVVGDAPFHAQVDGEHFGRAESFRVALSERTLAFCFPPDE